MSIITFWNDKEEQTGQTLSVAAIATYMAIEHNYRILVISSSWNDSTLENCFWEPRKKVKKNLGLFGPNTSIAMEDGIEGLVKLIRSNRVTPNNITNYTKIVFKDRLEILTGFKATKSQYDEESILYPDIINLANSFYDIVLVDLDNKLDDKTREIILNDSNLIIVTLSQRLRSINNCLEKKENYAILNSKKKVILIGRYDRYSKYTIKNISRYMKEKNTISAIPYNTLFFEAAEEATVPDLFLRLRQSKDDERNGPFITEIGKTVENIVYRLQNSQMK